jgi:hypothetical protein
LCAIFEHSIPLLEDFPDNKKEKNFFAPNQYKLKVHIKAMQIVKGSQ